MIFSQKQPNNSQACKPLYKKSRGGHKRQIVFNSFLVVFAHEIVEELLEEAIAKGLSLLIVKVLSTAFLLVCTQTIKILFKRIIKSITYKEGYDKMEKIKTFLKWLFANKKSLSSTVVSALATGTGIVSSWTIEGLPQIMVSGFNIAPILYTVICLVCFILNQLGICGKGFETIKTYLERKQTEKAKAEAKAIEKEAKKELEAEKAKAEAEAKAVEAEAKKQLEADEQARKEAEFTAKVQAKKDEILAQGNNQ